MAGRAVGDWTPEDQPCYRHKPIKVISNEGGELTESYVPVSLFNFILSSLGLYAERIVELGFFYHCVVAECVNALAKEM